jgi:hypothetical protein
MKTAIITLSVIFLLFTGPVSAGNDLESPGINELITLTLLKNLAPVTPKEADFDEEIQGLDKDLSIGSLAPTEPKTAGFDDAIPEEMSMKEIFQLLAPKSPKEVEFNDQPESTINPNPSLR